MIGAYYHLAKPGIIRGNLLSVLAGFLLAARGAVDVVLLLAVMVGTALIIACGCVINNYLDRGIDSKMNRTKKRALVTGEISVRNACMYAVGLGGLGFAILLLWVNALTALVGLVGLFSYVVLYGVGKRKTTHGTLIGTIAGSTPPVAGYTAVTGRLDIGAGLLFLILVCWQMPHFYAIALFRLKDYKAAGLPVLPAVKGVRATKLQILLYIIAFIFVACLLALFEYTTQVYAAIMAIVGLIWVYYWFVNVTSPDYEKWAKKLFFVSLFVLLIWSATISVSSFFV